MVKYFYKKYEKDSHTDYKWKKYEANYHSGSSYYTWKKYDVDPIYSEGSFSGSDIKDYSSDSINGKPSYYFDETTGIFSTSGGSDSSHVVGKTLYQGHGSTLVRETIKKPTDGNKYVARNSKTSKKTGETKGDYISSTTGSYSYKNDGQKNSDGYWWVRGSHHTSSGYYSKGNYITSTYASYNYKDDGQKNSDGYWWERGSSRTTHSKGSFIEEFIAEDGDYPDDGSQGGNWYVKQGRAREKISELGVNTSNGNTILPIFKLSGYENQSSPLRIQTSNETGYFELVNTDDSNASALRIATNNGIRAIEKE